MAFAKSGNLFFRLTKEEGRNKASSDLWAGRLQPVHKSECNGTFRFRSSCYLCRQKRMQDLGNGKARYGISGRKRVLLIIKGDWRYKWYGNV
ncbi:hypothetical protein [Bacteroides salyersiae]|uniref:hypothetical protein n=1 Tax=Bacteroides salyersiae TaxID=291644 RepID=UPI0032C09452